MKEPSDVAQIRGLLTVFVGGVLAIVLVLGIVGRADQTAPMWPVSGTVIALALPYLRGTWRRDLALFSAGAFGAMVGGVLVGMPWSLALIIGVLTWIDMAIAAFILIPHVTHLDDMKRQSNIARFVLVMLLAPLITGILGAYPVSLFLKRSPLNVAITSALANSLGIALILPLVLFLRDRRQGSLQRFASKRLGLLATAVLVSVVAGVFWQNSSPFFFLLFPPLILVLLEFGLEGAVFSSLLIVVVGWLATDHGHGPLWLLAGWTAEAKLLSFQLFALVCVITALPVGALLDERVWAHREVSEAYSVYQMLLDNTQDAIVLSTIDGKVRFTSHGIKRLTGWTPDEYLAMDRTAMFHPEDQDIALNLLAALDRGEREQRIQYRLMQKNGDWRWVEANVRAYGEDRVAGYVGSLRDITKLRSDQEHFLEEQMRMTELAQTDPLTNLLNRRGLEREFSHFTKQYEGGYAILMIDVDCFKPYNDTYGHGAGDSCLAMIAAVLRKSVTRKGDLVARLGGEEFVVLFPNVELQDAKELAENIRLNVINLAIDHRSSAAGMITVSIGIAARDHSSQRLSAVLSEADRALYACKHKGRNCVTTSTEIAQGDMLVSFANFVPDVDNSRPEVA